MYSKRSPITTEKKTDPGTKKFMNYYESIICITRLVFPRATKVTEARCHQKHRRFKFRNVIYLYVPSSIATTCIDIAEVSNENRRNDILFFHKRRSNEQSIKLHDIQKSQDVDRHVVKLSRLSQNLG